MATGPTGPAAPTPLTTRSLVKFSGQTAPGNAYLADTGTAPIVQSNVFPFYPVPTAHNLFNLATNIGTFVVPANGAIIFEVVTGPAGNVVPGYSITYGPGDTGVNGVKSILFGPVPLPPNETFGLRVTAQGISTPVLVSAVIESE